MNTDKILDFIVEYYIWFVIGGLIIIMAIIGFIADRKKLLPTKNKVEKPKKVKKDEFDFDNDIPDDETLNVNDEKVTVDQPDDVRESEENTSDLRDSWNIETNADVSSNKEVNNITEETPLNYEDVSIKKDSTQNSENYYSDNNSASTDNNSPYYDENYLDKTSDDYSSNDTHRNQNENYYENELPQNKVQEIKEDINKIDDMFPDKTNDIPEKTKDLDYKNNGDNSEQTLQVNYSQLREMVEDIIAETKNESNQNKVVENELEVENQTVQDIPLPNLNHISVDAIKAQDEDEDDVWKF